MSQSFTLESIELLGQSKLQIGEKNKGILFLLGSSGDNLRSTGEYIGHNFLNWKDPRIPSSSPPFIPKINLQFVDYPIWTLIFALSSHQLLNCRGFKFCKRKLGNMGKTKHYGICWLTPLFGVFFSSSNFFTAWCGFYTTRLCFACIDLSIG